MSTLDSDTGDRPIRTSSHSDKHNGGISETSITSAFVINNKCDFKTSRQVASIFSFEVANLPLTFIALFDFISGSWFSRYLGKHLKEIGQPTIQPAILSIPFMNISSAFKSLIQYPRLSSQLDGAGYSISQTKG